MNLKQTLGRRKFLAGLSLGAVGAAAACFLGRWGMRASNRRLRDGLALLQGRREDLPPQPGRQDLKGVLHAHTLLSPDSRGTPAEVVAAAREAGLRFLMMTDHNNPRIFREGIQGEFGDLLIIRGAEMIKDGQTILALGTKEFIDGHHMPIQQAVREIRSQGGLAIVGHPWRFREWEVEGIDGIEIYNVADAAYAQAWKLPWMAMEMLSSWSDYPEEVLLGLLNGSGFHLSIWDRLLRARKLTGVAGNDAHQNVGFLGMQLDSYPLDFRFVQNHLLAEGPDERSLLQALRAGHAYVSFGLLADATGFRFTAGGNGTTGIMGDSLPLAPGLVLAMQAPLAGEMHLFRNGEPIRQARSSRLEYPVTEKGVYRGQVFLEVAGDRFPWILSNPITIS